jgi:DNA-binding transcriptional regulator PaaX
MKKEKVSDQVICLTGGLLIRLSDILLYSVYLFGSSIGKSNSSRGVYQTFAEADKAFEQFNTKTIIQALQRLNYESKLIKTVSNKNQNSLKITEEGKKHLENIIPIYRKERTWNGKFYLVSFDIPEKKRRLREILRMKLKLHSGGLLQDSLWITPFDPGIMLESISGDFQKNLQLMIFPVGSKDLSACTNCSISELIEKAYHLSELNEKYRIFLKTANEERMYGVYRYLSILKADPQLPFVLEPKGFLGKEAYKVYQNVIS